MVFSTKTLAVEITLDACGHSSRLMELAAWAAARFGLGADFLEAARIHDVGKLYLPRYDLLHRPLTAQERVVFQSHVTLSWQYAVEHRYSRMVQDVALMHHERWDGQGYILGTGGADIPLAARVMAVLDAYDAMRVGRPYRAARSRDEALLEIERGAGTQFDPEVAAAFVRYEREERWAVS
ncbi:metal dependent phosphohydrolase [Meiothermus ruber H328]|mgnify:CR=1 FL=1|nr:metal dependent phosphohydrolase [Meiothermus ruber H328]